MNTEKGECVDCKEYSELRKFLTFYRCEECIDKFKKVNQNMGV